VEMAGGVGESGTRGVTKIIEPQRIDRYRAAARMAGMVSEFSQAMEQPAAAYPEAHRRGS
jgi:hypothetical protein